MNPLRLVVAAWLVALTGSVSGAVALVLAVRDRLRRVDRALQGARVELRQSTPRDLELERRMRDGIVRTTERRRVLRAIAGGERDVERVEYLCDRLPPPVEYAVEADAFGTPRAVQPARERRGVLITGPWKARSEPRGAAEERSR